MTESDASSGFVTRTLAGQEALTGSGLTDAAQSETDSSKDGTVAQAGAMDGNQAPVAVDDSYNVQSGDTLTVDASSGILANDSDADGDSLRVTSVEAPVHGSIRLLSDGSFVYTPDAGFAGTEKLTYTVTDGIAVRSAELVINVINREPVIVDDTYTVHAGDVLNIAAAAGILANDSDPDGQSLTVTSITAPAHGSIRMLSDGSFDYTPDAGFVGNETLTYTATDGYVTRSGTMTIAVTNSAPVLVDDSYTTHAGQTLAISAAAGLLANDSDPDGDALTVTSIEAPANGNINVLSDGSFTYTPDSGFTGSETLTYTATDGVKVVSGTVVITVGNAAPIAAADSYSTRPGEALTISAAAGVLANDSDADGDALSVTSVTAPAHGSIVMKADGSFIYTPDAGFVGSETLTYTVTDGVVSRQGSLTLDVVNSLPVAGADSYSVHAGEALSISAAAGILANDSDADGDTLSMTSIAAPEHGRIVMQADGSFTYRPDAGFTGSEQLTYTVTDGYQTVSGSMTINVTNAGPVAVNDSYSVQSGQTINIAAAAGVLANDSDADGDMLTVTSIEAPANGRIVMRSDGSFTYTPDAGFAGSEVLTYTVTDGTQTSTGQLVLSVAAGNLAPVAQDDAFTVAEDVVLSGDLLADNGQGADSDPDGDALSVVAVNGVAAHVGKAMTLTSGAVVTVNADGTFSYDQKGAFDALNSGDTATDSFTYSLGDGAGLTDMATVMLTIQGQDDVTPRVQITGTDGFDRLVGTDADEILDPRGGRVDQLIGGGGADVFDFRYSAGNGVREMKTVIDFTAGEDMLDLGAASVLATRVIGTSTYLFLDQDGDIIVLLNNSGITDGDLL